MERTWTSYGFEITDQEVTDFDISFIDGLMSPSEDNPIVQNICSGLPSGLRVRTLINNNLAPGYHNVEFWSEQLPAGIHFIRIEAGSYNNIKKMLLMK